jgi:methylmalonyl-CoA/ethylmalonyl-CoA epimerase
VITSLADHPFHGPIHHLGYVVEDLEASVERLVSTLGAGPFFVVRDVPLEQVTCQGEPATFHHDSAFGQCGAMPIEIIQLKRLEPERLREGFSQSPPQLHHTAYVVAREHLAETRGDLERRGLPAFLHATMGDLDLTFHDAASLTGHHMELHADSQGSAISSGWSTAPAWAGTAATHCDRRPTASRRKDEAAEIPSSAYRLAHDDPTNGPRRHRGGRPRGRD